MWDYKRDKKNSPAQLCSTRNEAVIGVIWLREIKAKYMKVSIGFKKLSREGWNIQIVRVN